MFSTFIFISLPAIFFLFSDCNAFYLPASIEHLHFPNTAKSIKHRYNYRLLKSFTYKMNTYKNVVIAGASTRFKKAEEEYSAMHYRRHQHHGQKEQHMERTMENWSLAM